MGKIRIKHKRKIHTGKDYDKVFLIIKKSHKVLNSTNNHTQLIAVRNYIKLAKQSLESILDRNDNIVQNFNSDMIFKFNSLQSNLLDKKGRKLLLSLLLLIFTISSSLSQTLVTTTVYNAVPAQTNSDPGHTASMFKLDLTNPYKHRIIAVSRDLLKKFPMHSKVRIQGTDYDGVYVVEDKMNKRYTKRIDILINVEMPIGKWENVKLTKIN
jgi:3D (Asp-Asp-Asp) domain-containing protein